MFKIGAHLSPWNGLARSNDLRVTPLGGIVKFAATLVFLDFLCNCRQDEGVGGSAGPLGRTCDTVFQVLG